MRIEVQQRGFSLIELLIALGLGLMLTAGVVVVFVQNNRSAVQDEEISRVLENGRYVLRTLGREIAMSGFWGKFLDPDTTVMDPSVDVGQDCGDGTAWVTDLDNLQLLDNATSVTAAATFNCLPAEIVTSSDIIAIKRVADFEVDDADVEAQQLYLRTNGVAAQLFRGQVGPLPVMLGTVANWPYTPSVFYLRNYSFNPGDGIPALCKAELSTAAPPGMFNQCLVEGVENLQIEFGVDDDDDFIADYFTSAPTDAEVFDSVAVRVHVLVRSLNEIPNYTNDKTYSMGQLNIAPVNDGFFRRVFSTTVVLRNPANLAGIGG